jgi:predicted RNase H-like HicB family nuclease
MSLPRHSAALEGSGAMKKTYHEYRGYVFAIAYQAKQPAYLVRFPDLPTIITSGATLAEAFAHACEALDLHLESLHKLNLPIPRPKHRLVVNAKS